MKLLTATVASQPRQCNTKHGPRLACDLKLHDGQKETIWRPANDAELSSLQRGQQINLGLTSDGKYHIIPPDSPTSPPAAQAKLTLSDSQKREIAQYIDQMGDLYGYCFQVAATKLGDNYSEEIISRTATSLFIAAQRKFNLT